MLHVKETDAIPLVKPGRRPWRVGREIARTLYDADGNVLGMLDDADLAGIVVACVNAPASGSVVVLDPRCVRCGTLQAPHLLPPDPDAHAPTSATAGSDE